MNRYSNRKPMQMMREALISPTCANALPEKALYLDGDTPLRAQIAFRILSKAMNTSKLVRVERTVSRKGKSFVTHKWVLPDKVKKGDTVIQNKAAYEKWKTEQHQEPSTSKAANSAPKINPMKKLAAKKKEGVKKKPETKIPPMEQKSKPETKKTQIKQKPETKKPPVKPDPPTGRQKPAEKKFDVRKFLYSRLDKIVADIVYGAMTQLQTPEERYEYLSTSFARNFMSDEEMHMCAEQCKPIQKKPEEAPPKKTETKPSKKEKVKREGTVKPVSVSNSETNPEKSAVSEKERKLLKNRLLAPGLSDSYIQDIENRFMSAPPEVLKAFNKYADNLSDCIGSAKAKTAYYSAGSDKVYFNSAEDAKGRNHNSKTIGSTLMHELGHLIDTRAHDADPKPGTYKTVSTDPVFLDAVRNDVKAAETAMKHKLGGVKIAEVRWHISQEIMKDGASITAGVQDIFGGAIKNKYPGSSWYHSAGYWSCNNYLFKYEERDRKLGTESFANMYEALSSEEATAAMEKWLPNAFKRFKELLAEITKD